MNKHSWYLTRSGVTTCERMFGKDLRSCGGRFEVASATGVFVVVCSYRASNFTATKLYLVISELNLSDPLLSRTDSFLPTRINLVPRITCYLVRNLASDITRFLKPIHASVVELSLRLSFRIDFRVHT